MSRRLPDHTPATLGDVRAMTLSGLLADAETCCDACEGKGEVYSYEWAEYNREMDVLTERLHDARRAHGLSIHEPLTSAWGPHNRDVPVPQDVADLEGAERELIDRMPGCQEYQPCDECDGSGWSLTEHGRQLMDLLRRHRIGV